jgi:hypothetical protein
MSSKLGMSDTEMNFANSLIMSTKIGSESSDFRIPGSSMQISAISFSVRFSRRVGFDVSVRSFRCGRMRITKTLAVHVVVAERVDLLADCAAERELAEDAPVPRRRAPSR